MKMNKRTDDRTKKQKKTHTVLVTATDRFLSVWGPCLTGRSKCAWACRPEDAGRVFDWVSRRSEMKFVRKNTSGKWYPKAVHVHIYCVEAGHPALAVAVSV